jgi:hypothetical protein
MNELVYDFKFMCQKGHVNVVKGTASDRPSEIECQECGEIASYTGFIPIKLGMTGRVMYEQNGRLAYRITDSKGNVTHRSVAKEHYYETGNIKPAYSDAYADHLKKSGQERLLREQTRDEIIKSRSETKSEVERKVTALTYDGPKKEDI